MNKTKIFQKPGFTSFKGLSVIPKRYSYLFLVLKCPFLQEMMVMAQLLVCFFFLHWCLFKVKSQTGNFLPVLSFVFLVGRVTVNCHDFSEGHRRPERCALRWGLQRGCSLCRAGVTGGSRGPRPASWAGRHWQAPRARGSQKRNKHDSRVCHHLGR